MRRSRSLLILLLLAVASVAPGQVLKSFSPDPAAFPEEAARLFGEISDSRARDMVASTLNRLTSYWNSNLFSEEEKSYVMMNAGRILSARLKPYPYFFYYFSVVDRLKSAGDPKALVKWSVAFDRSMQDASVRDVQDHLEQQYLFVSRGILYQSSSITWRITDTNFILHYDTVISYSIRTTNLICSSGKDSTVIESTGGTYFPATLKWTGSKGELSWEKVGLGKDTVIARLSRYAVELKHPSFKADSVVFYNRRYFREALFGSIEDRVMSAPPNQNSTYPRFSSYLRNYEIRNLFRDMDYLGGFTMEGRRLIGSGKVDENATLTISKGNKRVIILRSNAFIIEGDRISANPAALLLLAAGDSIYHPGLQVKYLEKTRELSFVRPLEGISTSPFFDSFHRVDIDCGAVYWNLDENTIRFESLRGINRKSTASFTSSEHYSIDDFYKIQGLDDRNPLYVIRNFVKTFSTTEVTPGMLAAYMQMPEDQVKAMLLRLSIKGFLYYDLVNDKAIVQDRLYHYIEANAGRQDYDVIRILSETFDQSNADLNISNFDLLIRGVREVFLSDSQNVYIYPQKNEILMKKGMDFVFTGNVKAGLFDFFAREGSFEYDSFRINLPHIDSLNFMVMLPGKDEMGKPRYKKVKSVIEDLGGWILIDEPNNKAGTKDFPEYPIFISEHESYVYYDKNPLYKRDFFRYHVDPFTLDSLDNFSTANLKFDGYLSTGGIFPEIEEPLSVQPDFSLGFVNRTPPGGYPVYGGKGNFNNDIDLSNLGLRARGTLTYRTSTLVSDNFYFTPQKTEAREVQELTIAEQGRPVEYPVVEADTVSLAWYPYQDTMIFRDLAKPFSMYRGEVDFDGEMVYSDLAMTGTGNVSFENSRMASQHFTFGRYTIDSDTVNFEVFGDVDGQPVITTLVYQAHVDFASRRVNFTSNRKESRVDFPYNRFVSYMEAINWAMDENQMLFTNNIAAKYPDYDKLSREELVRLRFDGSDFVSTDPAKDSLRFNCTSARYDLDDHTITAEGVRVIKIADAAVFPDSAMLRIGSNGTIAALTNAEVIADTLTQNHRFYGARVYLLSRNEYMGEGKYRYSALGLPPQEIPFREIGVDSVGRTVAKGLVDKDSDFWLSPYFRFQGNVSLSAGQPHLGFEGGFRILEDCYQPGTDEWTYFKGPVDPLDVSIRLESPLRSVEGKEQELALFISDFDEEIFSSVFDRRKSAGDTLMVEAGGNISYDSLTRSYRVFEGSQYEPGRTANYFFINRRTCTIETAGPVITGLNLDYVGMECTGEIEYMIVPDSTELDLNLAIDFLFDENALAMIGDSIIASGARGIDLNHPRAIALLRHYLGEEGESALREDIGTYGTMKKLPEQLMHTFLLYDVKLFWSTVSRSYVSRGPLGVISIGDKPVLRYLNGYVELLRRRSGDGLSIYLEIAPLKWYFFDYRNGLMQTISSDDEYNAKVSLIKDSKRKSSKPGAETDYEYMISTRSKAIDFLRRMDVLSR